MATKDITDEQVVRAALKHRDEDLGTMTIQHKGKPFVHSIDVADLLQAETGQAYKVCIRAIERAAYRGYVDWGVVITRPFPTREGFELIGIPQTPYPKRPNPLIDWGDNLNPYTTPTP